jgi:hypothetical protein
MYLFQTKHDYCSTLIVTGESPKVCEEFYCQLKTKVDLKNLGEIAYCLGIKFNRNRTKREIYLSQGIYAQEVFERFNMTGGNPVETPLDPNVTLQSIDPDKPAFEQPLYRAAIGSLMYLAIATRPDISTTVNKLS